MECAYVAQASIPKAQMVGDGGAAKANLPMLCISCSPTISTARVLLRMVYHRIAYSSSIVYVRTRIPVQQAPPIVYKVKASPPLPSGCILASPIIYKPAVKAPPQRLLCSNPVERWLRSDRSSYKALYSNHLEQRPTNSGRIIVAELAKCVIHDDNYSEADLYHSR